MTRADLIETMARAVDDVARAQRLSGMGIPEQAVRYSEARAAFAAIEAAGYRVVPVEPTEAMADAMLEANIHPPHQSDGSVSVRAQNAHIYAAMLDAAPKHGGPR